MSSPDGITDGTKTCAVCFDDFDSKQTIDCVYGHVFCDECFSCMIRAQLQYPEAFILRRGKIVCEFCMADNGATLASASQLAEEAADAAADALAEDGGLEPEEGEPASAADKAAVAAAAGDKSKVFFFSNDDIASHAPAEYDAYWKLSREEHLVREIREREEVARKARMDEFAGFGEAETEEKAKNRRVAAHRDAIYEQILTPRCPTCHVPFTIPNDFSGEFAFYCDVCVGGGRFCGYCLFVAEGASASVVYQHVRDCPFSLQPGSYFPPKDRPAVESFNQSKVSTRKAQIQTYLAEQVTAAADRPFVIAAIARNCADLGIFLDPA